MDDTFQRLGCCRDRAGSQEAVGCRSALYSRVSGSRIGQIVLSRCPGFPASLATCVAPGAALLLIGEDRVI
jgi:hypothetical protein